MLLKDSKLALVDNVSDLKKIILVILIIVFAYIVYYQNSVVNVQVSQDPVVEEVTRPFLGVGTYLITDEISKLQLLPIGAYVQEVLMESAAGEAGIQVGDVILQVGEDRIDMQNSLSRLILSQEIGKPVEILLYRNGTEFKVTVSLRGFEDFSE